MSFILFLKGFLMGLFDVVPGISGGTLAFITGIYEQFIKYIKNLTYFKFKTKEILFLFFIFLGIGSAILTGSKLILYLLKTYPNSTLSFFIGLIIASSYIMQKKLKEQNFYFSLLGLILGILLAFIIPSAITPSLPYIFIAGFIAISAMFLPGISGAFILLIMGVYEYLIQSLHDINTKVVITFIAGAGLGALFISRIISYFLKKYKTNTLSLLLGLVVGCLSIPLKKITLNYQFPLFVFLGFILIFIINKFQK